MGLDSGCRDLLDIDPENGSSHGGKEMRGIGCVVAGRLRV